MAVNKHKHKSTTKLEYRIRKIEKHLDKMMSKSKRKVKCCLKHWVCWWETIKEKQMARRNKKPMSGKKGGRRGGKKRRG